MNGPSALMPLKRSVKQREALGRTSCFIDPLLQGEVYARATTPNRQRRIFKDSITFFQRTSDNIGCKTNHIWQDLSVSSTRLKGGCYFGSVARKRFARA